MGEQLANIAIPVLSSVFFVWLILTMISAYTGTVATVVRGRPRQGRPKLPVAVLVLIAGRAVLGVLRWSASLVKRGVGSVARASVSAAARSGATSAPTGGSSEDSPSIFDRRFWWVTPEDQRRRNDSSPGPPSIFDRRFWWVTPEDKHFDRWERDHFESEED